MLKILKYVQCSLQTGSLSPESMATVLVALVDLRKAFSGVPRFPLAVGGALRVRFDCRRARA